MVQDSCATNGNGWLEASGLRQILRTLGLAVQPAKLGIALVAIVLTLVLGVVLDWVWIAADSGVESKAITEYVLAAEVDKAYTEPRGDQGIFEVWRRHEQQCVSGMLYSSLPGMFPSAATGLPAYAGGLSRCLPLGHLISAGRGLCWLVSNHLLYFILFGVGSLLIWACAGGAICRIAALQFAQDEKITVGEAVRFSRENLMGGFALAPCIPIALILLAMLLMAIGGAVLRIPVFGDVVAGAVFVLALLGGLAIAALLLGLLVGGSLFWPAVAVEGQDAYDAFSRGFSFAFSKPWKTVLYALLIYVYAGICWVGVNLFASFVLAITHSVVSFGTSPFGWWNRGSAEQPMSKLELLWPSAGGPFAWPNWGDLAWYECISASLIGIYVLLVLAFVWSFLASFYFSGSTVIYLLLRRDVDGTELTDVHTEDLGEEPDDSSAPAPSAAPASAAEAPATDTEAGPAPASGAGVAPETRPEQRVQPELPPAPETGSTPEPSAPAPPSAEPPVKPTDESLTDSGKPDSAV